MPHQVTKFARPAPLCSTEGAVQTVLSHTVGGLGHHCDMMIERAHERMKDLDVRVTTTGSPSVTLTSRQ